VRAADRDGSLSGHDAVGRTITANPSVSICTLQHVGRTNDYVPADGRDAAARNAFVGVMLDHLLIATGRPIESDDESSLACRIVGRGAMTTLLSRAGSWDAAR
jgi:hypothetical protein